VSADVTRQCPYCAETIKAAAVLCRFCGHDLAPPDTTAVPAPVGNPVPAVEPSASTCLDQSEIFDLLTVLVEKSLVVYEEDEQGRGRYRLLETVRQYGRDRLLEAGDGEPARDRHLGFYLSLGEQAEKRLRSAEQVEWLDLLETEHDNVRAAIAWSLGRDPEAAVQLAGAMAWFWFLRCHWREGREQLEAALRPPPGGAGAAWVRALAGMCWLVYGGGDYAGLHALVDQYQALAREAGDGWHLAFALGFRAMEAMSQGEPDRAAPASQESLELAQEIGDPWLLSLLASLAAQVLHVETHDQAEALLGKAAALGEQTGDRFLIGLAWGNLAGVNLLQGRYEEARTRVMQSMRQMLELQQRALLAPCLEILAGAEAGKKCGARAAQLLGAAAALRGVLGYPVERIDLRFHDWAVSATRDQLTPEEFAAAWAAGRALTLEQVLADILEEQADA
jgi:hypothetical protein